MQKRVTLITGASGEVGHGLIKHLCDSVESPIVTLDIQPLSEELSSYCQQTITGDILDKSLLDGLSQDFQIDTIYHLASILSTSAEKKPEKAHLVNVDGTLNLLELAVKQAAQHGGPIKFMYPSSIAVYGLPDVTTKAKAGAVTEDEFCVPTTMYGCNKLYCEHLGRYYADHYRQLTSAPGSSGVDFRGLRYPGLISADTVPTGGTSDYGPEMLHHAAQGKHYDCFVRPDAQLPFMAMPDAILALTMLHQAPRESLSRHIYNVTSFSLTAAQILEQVHKIFPEATVDYKPDVERQGIVDSWPADLNDNAARNDWGWAPEFDTERAFNDYLMPAISARYA
ncbi:MAG: NAD-dependent epimerase/dehydratase family protein [Anaerolineales bacterium]|jgi:nucleoside-diphosphate-sugar epimerase